MTLPSMAEAAVNKRGFTTGRKVRFADCDPAGIIYTGAYVDMVNGAIEDFFGQALGLDYYGFITDEKVGLGYVRYATDFMRPGFMGDDLEFVVSLNRIGRSSIGLEVKARRGDDSLMHTELVIVTTDLVTHAAIPLPPPLRAALTRFQDQSL